MPERTKNVQIFIGMKCLVKGRFIHRNIAVLTNKNFVYTAKSAAHMFPAGDCNGSVHCHHQNRGRCQRVAECRRTEMCHIHQQRLREKADNTAGDAKEQRSVEADPPVKLERQIAVVPPSGMEAFFQCPGGQIFHSAA